MILTMLFVAAILGLVVGLLAKDKGRSAGAWWFYGFMLFPIALIHVMLLRPDGRLAEAQELAAGDRRKCPHCAEVIKAEAKVCRFCGRDVEPVAAATPASDPAAHFLG